MWQEIVVASVAQSIGGLVYLLVACLDFFGKRQPTLPHVFLFSFSFLHVLNSTRGKFIMRVTHPTSPHPLPICCCALERRGNRHWSLLPSHMHVHTPPSTSLSIDMPNVFVEDQLAFPLVSYYIWLLPFSDKIIDHIDRRKNDNIWREVHSDEFFK